MSQVKIQGGASGSDNYTILAPATSTGDKTLTLPTATATLASTDANTFTGVQTFPAGSVSAPAITTTGDTNTGVYFPGADSVAITTGGTAAVTVDSGQRTKFPTTIGIGNATPSTSGCGITFPASENLSTNANTLDDYEEGTWTATDASGAGLTLTGTTQKYTKIGRLVTLSIDALGIPSNASGASIAIGGLPFTVSSAVSLCGLTNYTTNAVALYAHASSTQMFAYNVPSNFVRTTNANLSGVTIFGDLSYVV